MQLTNFWTKFNSRPIFIFQSMTAGDPYSGGLSRHQIMNNITQIFKRLQTDYIDLLYVQMWDDGTPIEETLRALTDLVRAGKVRYLGASNFTGWQVHVLSVE